MKTKAILLTSLLSTIAAPAFSHTIENAEDSNLKVTLNGSLDSQYYWMHQKKPYNYSNPGDNTSPQLRKNGIVNDTRVSVKVDGESDEYDLKYGAMIKLFGDTSIAKEFYNSNSQSKNNNKLGNLFGKSEQTMLYLEGMFGRLEMGSYTGVSKTMQAGATRIAVATGGIDGDARYFWNYNGSNGNSFNQFLETPNLPLNEIGRYSLAAKNANKVSYYTPDMMGFRAGVSYIPDSQTTGTIAQDRTNTKTILTKGGLYRAPAYKNVVEAGVMYETMFDDEWNVKASFVGQMGMAKKNQFETAPGVTTTAKLYKKLRAWEVGLNMSYMGFNVGGAYGNWNKSGTLINNSTKSTRYWNAGVGYDFGPFASSVTYFNSENGYDASNDLNNLTPTQAKRNKFDMVSVGLQYRLAPGLLPYIEYNKFKFKDRSGQVGVISNKGDIVLAGAKIQF